MSTAGRTLMCSGQRVRQVGNSEGRQWRVRIIGEGEAYGLTNAKTNDSDEPLVEFYDATYAGDDRFGPLGQFVSRYGLGVLRGTTAGLNLDGGSARWFIDAEPLADVKEWVEEQVS